MSAAVEERTPEGGEPTRCGFVAIIGAPNAGKSTLVNMLVGAKVAIVTPKVQTTRTRLLGIALHGRAQIVLVDTPGIFRPRRRFERAMVKAAWKGASDADEIVLNGVTNQFRRGVHVELLHDVVLDRLDAAR